jgi:hypothetical protein
LQFKGSVTPPTRCKVKLQTEILQLTNLNCFLYIQRSGKKKINPFQTMDRLIIAVATFCFFCWLFVAMAADVFQPAWLYLKQSDWDPCFSLHNQNIMDFHLPDHAKFLIFLQKHLVGFVNNPRITKANGWCYRIHIMWYV